MKNNVDKIIDNKCHEYTINGTKFIVTPVFRQDGNETLKTLLLKLIKSEVSGADIQ